MYIKEIDVENLGPLEKANIKFSFNEDGTPKPLVLVGKNGSGKSTLISNIVDFFYEFSAKAYSNIQIYDKNKNQFSCFFKILSPKEITVGKNYLYSHIRFDEEVEYRFVNGFIPEENFIGIGGELNDLKKNNGYVSNKKVDTKQLIDEEIFVKKILMSQVIAYFPPNRYEKPGWLHNSYYERMSSDYVSEDVHLSISEIFRDEYKNPITVNCGENDLLHWILDVIVDSRLEVDLQTNSKQITGFTFEKPENKKNFSISKNNIQKILTIILGREVKFELNPRSYQNSRFNIVRAKDNYIISPSLSSLSSGQIALFKMFATIVKYADSYDVQRSCDLSNIKGIVVIDEIELHLHPSMQADILPKLIDLFPKVQFIITTHSPLFLLGMDKVLGKDSYDLIDLPSATKISTETYSEFKAAFECYEKTDQFEKELQSVLSTINSNNYEPLLITEGQTDWVHLESAYLALSNIEENKDIFKQLENIRIFEYEAKGQSHKISKLGLGVTGHPLHKVEMGDNDLLKMCESLSKLPRSSPLICIFDHDNTKIIDKVMNNGSFKYWGNNVYSFSIPVPENRKDTPLISIEHYYSDDEIKTPQKKDNVECRLYMGNEFDERGRSKQGNKLCTNKSKCGTNKINILSRGKEEIVKSDLTDEADDVDYSLSKSDFAWNIYNKEAGFNNFDFSDFIKIFEMIRDIIEHHNSQKQKESPVNIINDGPSVNQ
ncbi:MAG: AAA family ATPase [Succinivibrio sp.]|nr:AAA family ATPase [Succinivibrio sp.]